MKKIQLKNKDVFAFCGNCALALLEILGVIFIFTVALNRGTGTGVANWNTFKYYTTDSNIIMLISCIISIVYMALYWKGKIKQIPQWTHIVKLIATTGVALTMFITLFVLMPGTAILKHYPVASLFLGSNLFMHLVNPIVSILIFLLFENRKDVKITKTLYGLIPLLIYGTFYLCMAYTHVKPDGTIPMQYDWYKFCSFGPIVTPFIFVGITGIYYLFTWLFWLGNRKISIKSLA